MDTVLVLATDVNTSKVLRVVHTILRQSPQMGVVLILYVLLVFIDVIPESVTDVRDVLPTSMDITSPTSVP
jgi:hypothetical protein